MGKIDNKMLLFMGPVLIALGVILNVTMKESSDSIGIVFIAVGGLFFIIGMVKKKKEDEKRKK